MVNKKKHPHKQLRLCSPDAADSALCNECGVELNVSRHIRWIVPTPTSYPTTTEQTMANPLRAFDQYRLDTAFVDGRWQHSIPCGSCGATKLESWSDGALLGSGTFGTVRLSKGEGRALRAIKKIANTKATTMSSPHELLAMTKLNLVNILLFSHELVTDIYV